jgi:hypothetical protein
MTAKHALLDHVIPPEREILPAKLRLLEPGPGLMRLCRSGEQYIGACTRCPEGSRIATSSPTEAFAWFTMHEEH